MKIQSNLNGLNIFGTMEICVDMSGTGYLIIASGQETNAYTIGLDEWVSGKYFSWKCLEAAF